MILLPATLRCLCTSYITDIYSLVAATQGQLQYHYSSCTPQGMRYTFMMNISVSIVTLFSHRPRRSIGWHADQPTHWPGAQAGLWVQAGSPRRFPLSMTYWRRSPCQHSGTDWWASLASFFLIQLWKYIRKFLFNIIIMSLIFSIACLSFHRFCCTTFLIWCVRASLCLICAALQKMTKGKEQLCPDWGP